MSAVMAPGEVTKVGTGMQGEAIPSRLTTRLYDVIAAPQDVPILPTPQEVRAIGKTRNQCIGTCGRNTTCLGFLDSFLLKTVR
jgi:hypothetical protein